MFRFQVTLYIAVSNGSIITKYRIGKDEGKRGAGLISFIRRLRIAAKSAYDLRHVRLYGRLSFCSHILAPTGQMSVKFDIGGCREIPNLVKTGQKCLVTYANT